MSTTQLVRVLRALGLEGDVEEFVADADEDEIHDLILDLARMSDRTYDTSDLSGETDPVSLEEFLRVNEECPPDDAELAALVTCGVGENVKLGIGGGHVTVRRVS